MKICAVEDGNLDFTRRSGAKWEDDNPKLTSLTLQKKSLHWELQYAADVYGGPSDQRASSRSGGIAFIAPSDWCLYAALAPCRLLTIAWSSKVPMWASKC